ncbi:MAG TPA: hypothetical protein VGX23_11215 [Actinocrinis sp.]|nr:hypothetical protein [Actinocrinis sp.]
MTPAGHRTGPLDHGRVVRLLAAFGDRAPESVDDVVGSLELTWLIAQVEEQYAVVLDLRDEQLARITTVADAAEVLGEAVGAALDENGAADDSGGGGADSQARQADPALATVERG